jgi:hypothetical protein
LQVVVDLPSHCRRGQEVIVGEAGAGARVRWGGEDLYRHHGLHRVFIPHAEVDRQADVARRQVELAVCGMNIEIGAEGGIGLGRLEDVVSIGADPGRGLLGRVEAQIDELIAEQRIRAQCAEHRWEAAGRAQR